MLAVYFIHYRCYNRLNYLSVCTIIIDSVCVSSHNRLNYLSVCTIIIDSVCVCSQWDKRMFPNPIEMQQNVSRHGRKMVTIVDPHIKRDDAYPVHKEATNKGLYIKNKDGADFDGWCWPGSSSYLDFTSSTVREWWARQFGLDKYLGSTLDLFTWNDMNEPSVFNGPEVSMPKDAKNLAGVEHREWHNLYGIYMQMATALGLTTRSPTANNAPQQRPFVLTRSFWAGKLRLHSLLFITHV